MIAIYHITILKVMRRIRVCEADLRLSSTFDLHAFAQLMI